MLRRLLLGCLGIVLGLCVAEAALRLYLSAVPPPRDAVYRADAAAGFLLVSDPPEHAAQAPDDHINALGFRDREHETAKAPGTLRIVGIGDSFVYGSTPRLEDHFLRVAAARLATGLPACDSHAFGLQAPGALADESARRDPLSVEMLLMGIGGYSPEHYPGLLRGHALALAPDWVVLNFYVGNDVTGIPLSAEVWRGRLYHTGSAYPWLDALRHSRIFVLAERVVRAGLRERLVEIWLGLTGSRRFARVPAPGAREAGAPAPPARPASPAPAGVSTWRAHQQMKDLPVYAISMEGATAGLWRRAEARLEEFDRLSRSAGVPWVLHLIPADLQVDADLRDEVLTALRLDAARYDFDAPQRRLTAWATARGVPVVDPLPALRGALDAAPSGDPAQALYEANDIHWTVRGNRLAGEILGEGLIRYQGSRALLARRP